jgi:hypothetical protein
MKGTIINELNGLFGSPKTLVASSSAMVLSACPLAIAISCPAVSRAYSLMTSLTFSYNGSI